MTSFDDLYDDAPFYYESLVHFSFEKEFDEEFRREVESLHANSDACDASCGCVINVRLARLLEANAGRQHEVIANLLKAAMTECEVDSSVAYTHRDVEKQAFDLAGGLLQQDVENVHCCLPLTESGNDNGKTILHMAVECDCYQAVEIFVNNCRDLLFISSLDKTPLLPIDLARDLQRQKVFKYLREKMLHAMEPNRFPTSDLSSDHGLFQFRPDVLQMFLIVAEKEHVNFAENLKSHLEGISSGKLFVHSSVHAVDWQARLSQSDAVVILASEALKNAVDGKVDADFKAGNKRVLLPGELIHRHIDDFRERCVLFHYNEEHIPQVATHVNGAPTENGLLKKVPYYCNINRKELRKHAQIIFYMIN